MIPRIIVHHRLDPLLNSQNGAKEGLDPLLKGRICWSVESVHEIRISCTEFPLVKYVGDMSGHSDDVTNWFDRAHSEPLGSVVECTSTILSTFGIDLVTISVLRTNTLYTDQQILPLNAKGVVCVIPQ